MALLLGGFARDARAQAALVTDIITDQTYDAGALSAVGGHGYELAHGLLLRPSFHLEGGATSNVFYTAAEAGPTASGLLRLSGAVYLSNDEPRREQLADDGSDAETPLDYRFRGGVRMTYQEFLSGNSAVRAQRHFNVLSDVDFVSKPAGPWSLIVQDQYRRDTSSLTFEDISTLNRDDNRLYVGGRFQADGGGLSLTVHYENWVQLFEDSDVVSLPTRMNHTIGLGGQYQVGGDDQTALLADVSYGFFRTLGAAHGTGFDKPNSQPLRVVIGLAHELSSIISGHAEAGFARASYAARVDGRAEGYNAPVALVDLGVRWTRTGRMLVRYRYDHYDSLISNFYRDHEVEVKLIQQLGVLVLDGGPEVHFRQYSGMPIPGADLRDDTILAVRARLQAVLAERYSFSLEYLLSRVSTDYFENALDARGNVIGAASYSRHDLLAGLTVTY